MLISLAVLLGYFASKLHILDHVQFLKRLCVHQLWNKTRTLHYFEYKNSEAGNQPVLVYLLALESHPLLQLKHMDLFFFIGDCLVDVKTYQILGYWYRQYLRFGLYSCHQAQLLLRTRLRNSRVPRLNPRVRNKADFQIAA